VVDPCGVYSGVETRWLVVCKTRGVFLVMSGSASEQIRELEDRICLLESRAAMLQRRLENRNDWLQRLRDGADETLRDWEAQTQQEGDDG
jgi:chaperonin cofactor prefoldin